MIENREQLMAASRGYWQARAILTAVELDLFRALGGRKLGAQALARRLDAEPRALGLLLDCLVGQGVLQKHARSFSITPALRPLLLDGPESAAGMLRHHAALWHSWSGLTEAVRTGRSRPSESSFRRGPEHARTFTLAMRDGARRLAPLVAAELPLRGRKCLLDLGGGPGVYAAEFARANPGLEVIVVDLPDVVAVGAELIESERDIRNRVSFHASNLRSDPLPAGADAAFLSHVIHGDDEATNRELFARIAAALGPRGLLVVREFFLDPDRTTPAANSLFSLNMLVHTPAGRCYTGGEVTAWLRAAGFATVSRRRSRAAADADYLLARTP